MKKWAKTAVLLGTIGLLGAYGQQAVAKQTTKATTESTTKKVSKTKQADFPYHRVLAGTGTVAEYLAAFDIPLKGVSEQDDLPAKDQKLPRIGQPRELNMEKIVSLKPDLFIGDKSLANLSQDQLQKQNIPSLYLDNSSYDKVFESIEQIGTTFDQKHKADQLVHKLKKQEKSALAGSEKLQGKKVAILFGTGESYMLATKHSYLGSLLEKLGVENVADTVSKAPSPYVPFSLETVVAENPDYVLTLAHGHKQQAKQAFDQEMKKDLWQNTTAVKTNQVYALDDQTYPVTGNLHVMETVKDLKNLLLKKDLK